VTFNSPVEKLNLFGLNAFIKRDDLISKQFSGNKARKLFDSYNFFLDNHKKINHVYCYGSMQSNLLYSLSELTKTFDISFTYYVNRPVEFIEEHKNTGNLKAALDNKTNIISLNDKEYNDKKKFIQNNLGFKNNYFYITEGGASKEAAPGLEMLANEIIDFFNKENMLSLNVCLPSGTGSTIAYLNQSINLLGYSKRIKLFSTSIVVKNEILSADISDFTKLETNEVQPTLLECSKRYRYGKLNIDLFNIIQYLEKANSNIKFEYIYDPKMFISIKENLDLFKKEPFLYIHCGGLNTNRLMYNRYVDKYPELSII